MKEAFINTLIQMAETDRDLILVVGDLGFGMIEQFKVKYPKQYLNAGISEQNMIGLATGLALDGKKVFVYSIGNFASLRCIEQIRNDAAYHRANVNIIGMGGGFSYGPLGFSHHSTEDIALLTSMSELQVYCPADDWEVAEATRLAANQTGASYLRLDKTVVQNAVPATESFAVGGSRVLRRGSHATIFAAGGIAQEALNAATQFSHQFSKEVEVVSTYSLKPFDTKKVREAVETHGHIITIEEHNLRGGIGEIVSAYCLENKVVPKTFKRFGIQSAFESIVGDQECLRRHHKIAAPDVFHYLSTQLIEYL